ncbi:unnamed protein product [Closterium sp. NIES-54]
MRKLLRGMQLPNHQWPKAMDHAVMLHNLLSSSSLPNNASPHLLWTGKQGSTKMLRVFCQSEGLGFESQYVHFGHPSAGGCQRSTGDPRLILGKGYRLVVLGGYGRTDPLLNKSFYPNGLVVEILTFRAPNLRVGVRAGRVAHASTSRD